MPLTIEEHRARELRNREVVELLQRLFPAAFPPSGAPRPLMHGIHRNIWRSTRDVLSRRKIRLALQSWTRRPDYKHEVVEGAARVDLEGRPVAVVTEREAKLACGELVEAPKLRVTWAGEPAVSTREASSEARG